MSLIKCDECGNEVSNKAKACQKCGAPPPENSKEKTSNTMTARQAAKMTYKERRAFLKAGGTILVSTWQKVILWIAGIISIMVMTAQCSESPSPEEQARRDKEDFIFSVKYSCHTFIEKALNDPDSVIYGKEPSDQIIYEAKPGIWVVRQNLSARNAFNGRVKATYTCIMKYDKKDKEFYLIKLSG